MPRHAANVFSLFLPLLVAVMAVISLLPHPVYAQEAASVGVGDTSLDVSGRTSPDAFVTIQADHAVIGTTAADNSGRFSQSFPARSPGITQLDISALDIENRSTDNTTLYVNLQEHFPTSVDVFLPPTIGLSAATVRAGQTMQLTGMGLPGSQIIINLDNQTIGTAIVSQDGKWNFPLLTFMLPVGQHQLFAIDIDDNGNQSSATSIRAFTITSPPNRTAVPHFLASLPAQIASPGDGISPQPNTAATSPQKQLQIKILTEPSNIVSGKQVRVTAEAVNGIAPLSYTFIWGDGQITTISSSAKKISASHAYTRAGNYAGMIRIKDASGAITTSSFTIHVRQAGSLTPLLWLVFAIAVCFCLYLTIKKRLKLH